MGTEKPAAGKHSKQGKSPRPAWRILLNPQEGSARPIHILVGVLFVVLGLVITTTVRARVADPLAGLNEDQLVTILADLDSAEKSLLSERSQLQIELSQLNAAADAQKAAEEASAQALVKAEVSAGTIPVEGPGVILRVSGQTDGLPTSVFVTTLAEFRNAGAEALSVNGVRLNARAWFGSDESGRIVASGVNIDPPYEWRAIGDPDTLAIALEIRGGASAQFRAYGATVESTKSDLLVIDAVTALLNPEWAEPAPS